VRYRSEVNEFSPMMDIIESIPVPDCYLCGSKGSILYEGLSDAWCGAPGLWNLKRCLQPGCGLVWLDPMPSKKEIWKAYRFYFTHRDYAPQEVREIDLPNYLLIKAVKPFYKFFMHITGLRRFEKKWRRRGDSLFLDRGAPGRKLLDVGCGNGEFLARMRQQGWEVEGVEIDAKAIEWARAKHGLMVHQGPLERLQFPGDMFDAITMNHVIEHVHDPVLLLRECLRIQKPEGSLVVATPNVNSLAHRWFGRNWSNLDAPRHLRLFTRRNLKECAMRAGFRSVEVWCPPGYADGALLASVERVEWASGKRRGEFPKWLEASFLKIRAYFLLKGDEEAGEEVILMAGKDREGSLG